MNVKLTLAALSAASACLTPSLTFAATNYTSAQPVVFISQSTESESTVESNKLKSWEKQVVERLGLAATNTSGQPCSSTQRGGCPDYDYC